MWLPTAVALGSRHTTMLTNIRFYSCTSPESVEGLITGCESEQHEGIPFIR